MPKRTRNYIYQRFPEERTTLTVYNLVFLIKCCRIVKNIYSSFYSRASPNTSIKSILFFYFSDIATEVSVWDGVVVAPLERAYEKPVEKEAAGEEDMDANNQNDDTMETGE